MKSALSLFQLKVEIETKLDRSIEGANREWMFLLKNLNNLWRMKNKIGRKRGEIIYFRGSLSFVRESQQNNIWIDRKNKQCSN